MRFYKLAFTMALLFLGPAKPASASPMMVLQKNRQEYESYKSQAIRACEIVARKKLSYNQRLRKVDGIFLGLSQMGQGEREVRVNNSLIPLFRPERVVFIPRLNVMTGAGLVHDHSGWHKIPEFMCVMRNQFHTVVRFSYKLKDADRHLGRAAPAFDSDAPPSFSQPQGL